jgi:hypothetical protein
MPAFIGISGIRPHDGKSREGIYARGLPHSKTFIGSNGAHEGQAIGATEALAMRQSRMLEIEPEARGVWVGVAGRSFARPILDLFAFFRGPAFKNLAAAGSKNLGWPVKPAALTQRRCVIGQIALAATRHRPGAKTHQRPFLSHGEACCHD